MTRSHRRWHPWIWLILAPLLAAGLFAGLASRPPALDAPTGQPASQARKGAP